MRPRPRARSKPVQYVPPADLVAQVRQLRAEGTPPEAIIAGVREWALIKAQPGARPHLYCFPGDPDRLDGVMVITSVRWDRPTILLTPEEYEEAMLNQ